MRAHGCVCVCVVGCFADPPLVLLIPAPALLPPPPPPPKTTKAAMANIDRLHVHLVDVSAFSFLYHDFSLVFCCCSCITHSVFNLSFSCFLFVFLFVSSLSIPSEERCLPISIQRWYSPPTHFFTPFFYFLLILRTSSFLSCHFMFACNSCGYWPYCAMLFVYLCAPVISFTRQET